MGGVEVPRGVQSRKGYPLPTGGRVWGGGCAHSPENLSYFLLKIPHFDAF